MKYKLLQPFGAHTDKLYPWTKKNSFLQNVFGVRYYLKLVCCMCVDFVLVAARGMKSSIVMKTIFFRCHCCWTNFISKSFQDTQHNVISR
jgi:hypothetical protein